MTIRKNDRKKFLFLLGIVVFSVICTNLVLDYFVSQQIIDYKMHMIVGDHIGFDLNRKVITFGMVTPSGTATRYIDLSNGEHNNKVRVTAFGELAKWVTLSENDFVLQPYENKSLKISVFAPADVEFGNYTGSLRIAFRKL